MIFQSKYVNLINICSVQLFNIFLIIIVIMIIVKPVKQSYKHMNINYVNNVTIIQLDLEYRQKEIYLLVYKNVK